MSVYTPQQVADRFAIKRRQVIRKVAERKWPCLRISKKTIRFTDDHIAQIEALTQTVSFTNVTNLHGIKTRRSSLDSTTKAKRPPRPTKREATF